MKKYLKNICLACILVLLATFGTFFAVLAVVAPQYRYNYQASAQDKLARLNSIAGPKIILVGHSNLAFGIDSPMIEEALGMPVVNLGLHGGLGNAFHENMAKSNIGPGDIVVICHGSYADSARGIGDYALAWITLEKNFELWKLIPQEEWPNMLAAFPEYLKKSITLMESGQGNKATGSVYCRNAFNPYGDVALERSENLYTWSKGSVAPPSIEAENVRQMNSFIRYCTDRGAYPVIAAYPIGQGEFTPDHSLFRDAWGQLASMVHCPVISDVEDYFFDYSYFYDTHLHLTTEGAKLRTQQLIRDLTAWLESRN